MSAWSKTLPSKLELSGSGLVVINPPYTLHDELLEVLPFLTDVLGQYDGASYLLEQHAV